MFGDLGQSRQRGGFEVRGGASGHVVKNDRLVAHGLGNGLEMAVLAFLRGLVVVRRRGEDGVDSGARGNFFRLLDRVVRRVGRRSGDDGHAPGRDFDGRVDYVQPLVVRERGRLAGGAAGNQKINAGLDLPRDQIAQGSVVDRTILMKRSYQCSATSTELHRNKITRMRSEGKLGPSQGRLRPDCSTELPMLRVRSSSWVSSALILSCSVLSSCSAWISVVCCCCSMFPTTSMSDLTCLTLSCISVCCCGFSAELSASSSRLTSSASSF